jgi:hypothetical protein
MVKVKVRKNHPDVASEPRHVPTQDREPSASFAICEKVRLGTLVPGIIHNLSTPLSGVIGGIQLLEMRAVNIAEAVEKLDDSSHPQWKEVLDQLKRTQKSIRLISRNADSLSNLIQNLVARINRFSVKNADIYSLNQLVEMELQFLESNLYFKHRVRRSVHLQDNLPPLHCIFSIFAESLDGIVYTAIDLHGSQKEPLLELVFTTTSTPNDLALTIDCNVPLSRFEEVPQANESSASSGPGLQQCFAHLQEDSWEVEMRASDLGTLFELKHAPFRLASRK